MTILIKIPFPIISDNKQRIKFFQDLNHWFEKEGMVHGKDYRLEWDNTGLYTPQWICCDSETAVALKLKYGI